MFHLDFNLLHKVFINTNIALAFTAFSVGEWLNAYFTDGIFQPVRRMTTRRPYFRPDPIQDPDEPEFRWVQGVDEVTEALLRALPNEVLTYYFTQTPTPRTADTPMPYLALDSAIHFKESVLPGPDETTEPFIPIGTTVDFLDKLRRPEPAEMTSSTSERIKPKNRVKLVDLYEADDSEEEERTLYQTTPMKQNIPNSIIAARKFMDFYDIDEMDFEQSSASPVEHPSRTPQSQSATTKERFGAIQFKSVDEIREERKRKRLAKRKQSEYDYEYILPKGVNQQTQDDYW